MAISAKAPDLLCLLLFIDFIGEVAWKMIICRFLWLSKSYQKEKLTVSIFYAAVHLARQAEHTLSTFEKVTPKGKGNSKDQLWGWNAWHARRLW